MESIGRNLVVGGILLALVGAGIYLAARLGLPLGRLPGDIHLQLRSGALYVPITTSVLLSAILTLALNLLLRIFRK